MEHTDWGKPSYIVTKAVGGQKLHIKLQETVYHPGHYRVALAVNSPTELPLDPQATTRDSERGPMSLAAAIQNPPQIPVLADGLFVITRGRRVQCPRGRRMCSCRTSTVRSAFCKSCSSWPNTPSTISGVHLSPLCRVADYRLTQDLCRVWFPWLRSSSAFLHCPAELRHIFGSVIC